MYDRTKESTTDLNKILNSMKKEDLDHYLKVYSENKTDTFFQDYMIENGIASADIAKELSGYVSKAYYYEILNGKKIPRRDIVLMFCIVLKMNRKDVRRALNNYVHNDLYPKDKRDVIITTYINNEVYDINKINEELSRYNLDLLCKD